MHLDYRNRDGRKRVANRDARVSVRTWIYQDQVGAIAGLLNPIDYRTLGIRLETVDHETQLAPESFQLPVDIAKPGTAVDFRFALSQKIQVGPVNYQDAKSTLALGFAVTSAAPGSILLPRHVPAQLLAALNPTAPPTSSRSATAGAGISRWGPQGRLTSPRARLPCCGLGQGGT